VTVPSSGSPTAESRDPDPRPRSFTPVTRLMPGAAGRWSST
jgi:hypothetical protein